MQFFEPGLEEIDVYQLQMDTWPRQIYQQAWTINHDSMQSSLPNIGPVNIIYWIGQG